MSYQSLLFCPDDKTARVVTQVLTELEFSVELCNEPFATVKKLMAKQYDAIVVDCDNEQNAALLFKSARNSTSNHGCLAVAVVEGQAGVARAFRIGANLVLTKPVNVEQSKGTLRVARGLLKKAETGKSTAPGTSTFAPLAPLPNPISTSRAVTTSVPPQRSMSSASFAAGASGVSATPVAAASSATFEVQEDPTPQVEPTEAAFLDSIPKSVASRVQTSPAKTSHTHKESPWLPLSKTARESKEPDSGASSGNASQTHPDLRPTAAALTRVRHPFNTGGLSSGQGTAAAPAKEAASYVIPLTSQPKISEESRTESGESFSPGEAPDFSMGAETRRSKVPAIAALVVIALAGAGYFGWSRMQMQAKPASVQNQSVVPEPSIPVPTVPAQPALDASQTLAQAQAKPSAAQQLPQLNPSEAAEMPATALSSKAKSTPDEIVVVENSGSDPAVEIKPLPKKIHEPLAVKSAPADIEQTIAPPQLQVASNASDQTIAGLITSTSAPLPKRPTETLKMSQGITQGLLVKRVNPVYPNQALQMHKQGTVQILANITKNGSISSAKVIKGDPMLGQAALVAVKQWKYKPYTLDGQAVDIQTQISVNFKLP